MIYIRSPDINVWFLNVQRWNSDFNTAMLSTECLRQNKPSHLVCNKIVISRLELKSNICENRIVCETLIKWHAIIWDRVNLQWKFHLARVHSLLLMFVCYFCCAFVPYLTSLGSMMLIWAAETRCKWRAHLHNRMSW